MTKVIVTELEYGKAVPIFSNSGDIECIPAPAAEQQLAAAIRDAGARFAIVGTTKYRRELYDAIPPGGVIARFGVGHDGLDKAAARARGILCCNTPGVLDDSVAECAIGLMLVVGRRLTGAAADNKLGKWTSHVGIEFSGKTLAIIGCGNIGSKVARMARFGLGMRTIGVARRQPRDPAPFDKVVSDFAEAASVADVVSIHLPSLPETANYINHDRLSVMKPSAILINTARGDILDEDALYDAVGSHTIAAAALDVFKHEPYHPTDPEKDLRTLPAITMTPHIASSTQEACNRMAAAALKNIRFALQARTSEMNLV